MIPQVTPIEGEKDCFHVQSRSRPEILHRVEINGDDAECSCEESQCKMRTCAHIWLVRGYIQGFEDGFMDGIA